MHSAGGRPFASSHSRPPRHPQQQCVSATWGLGSPPRSEEEVGAEALDDLLMRGALSSTYAHAQPSVEGSPSAGVEAATEANMMMMSVRARRQKRAKRPEAVFVGDAATADRGTSGRSRAGSPHGALLLQSAASLAHGYYPYPHEVDAEGRSVVVAGQAPSAKGGRKGGLGFAASEGYLTPRASSHREAWNAASTGTSPAAKAAAGSSGALRAPSAKHLRRLAASHQSAGHGQQPLPTPVGSMGPFGGAPAARPNPFAAASESVLTVQTGGRVVASLALVASSNTMEAQPHALPHESAAYIPRHQLSALTDEGNLPNESNVNSSALSACVKNTVSYPTAHASALQADGFPSQSLSLASLLVPTRSNISNAKAMNSFGDGSGTCTAADGDSGGRPPMPAMGSPQWSPTQSASLGRFASPLKRHLSERHGASGEGDESSAAFAQHLRGGGGIHRLSAASVAPSPLHIPLSHRAGPGGAASGEEGERQAYTSAVRPTSATAALAARAGKGGKQGRHSVSAFSTVNVPKTGVQNSFSYARYHSGYDGCLPRPLEGAADGAPSQQQAEGSVAQNPSDGVGERALGAAVEGDAPVGGWAGGERAAYIFGRNAALRRQYASVAALRRRIEQSAAAANAPPVVGDVVADSDDEEESVAAADAKVHVSVRSGGASDGASTRTDSIASGSTTPTSSCASSRASSIVVGRGPLVGAFADADATDNGGVALHGDGNGDGTPFGLHIHARARGNGEANGFAGGDGSLSPGSDAAVLSSATGATISGATSPTTALLRANAIGRLATAGGKGAGVNPSNGAVCYFGYLDLLPPKGAAPPPDAFVFRGAATSYAEQKRYAAYLQGLARAGAAAGNSSGGNRTQTQTPSALGLVGPDREDVPSEETSRAEGIGGGVGGTAADAMALLSTDTQNSLAQQREDRRAHRRSLLISPTADAATLGRSPPPSNSLHARRHSSNAAVPPMDPSDIGQQEAHEGVIGDAFGDAGQQADALEETEGQEDMQQLLREEAARAPPERAHRRAMAEAILVEASDLMQSHRQRSISAFIAKRRAAEERERGGVEGSVPKKGRPPSRGGASRRGHSASPHHSLRDTSPVGPSSTSAAADGRVSLWASPAAIRPHSSVPSAFPNPDPYSSAQPRGRSLGGASDAAATSVFYPYAHQQQSRIARRLADFSSAFRRREVRIHDDAGGADGFVEGPDSASFAGFGDPFDASRALTTVGPETAERRAAAEAVGIDPTVAVERGAPRVDHRVRPAVNVLYLRRRLAQLEKRAEEL